MAKRRKLALVALGVMIPVLAFFTSYYYAENQSRKATSGEMPSNESKPEVSSKKYEGKLSKEGDVKISFDLPKNWQVDSPTDSSLVLQPKNMAAIANSSTQIIVSLANETWNEALNSYHITHKDGDLISLAGEKCKETKVSGLDGLSFNQDMGFEGLDNKGRSSINSTIILLPFEGKVIEINSSPDLLSYLTPFIATAKIVKD